MFPTLLEIGAFHLRTFGVLLAVSFLLGAVLALHRGKQQGMDEEFLLRLFWWILLSAVIGSRLYFILVHPEEFERPVDALRIWGGGMVLYGGLLAAILTSWWYCRRRGVRFLVVADVCAPSLALGEGLSRLGCFFNGCCFGRACDLPFGVHYPAEAWPSVLLGAGASVHPSPLYLSAGAFLILAVLLGIEPRLRRAGQLLGVYLVLAGILRFLVDLTRYYEPADRVTLGAVSVVHSQLLAVAAVVWGGLLLRARRDGASAGSQVEPQVPSRAPSQVPSDPGTGAGSGAHS